MRRPTQLALVFALAVALLAGGGTGVLGRSGPVTARPFDRAVALSGAAASVDAMTRSMTATQARLRRLPSDWTSWAALGAIYVQQGRITADPTYYPKAQGALDRSLRLNGTDNYQAMAGLGALTAARHDFAGALTWTQKASRINPYNASVYGVMGDALVELGRYPEAYQAIQRMVNLKPGLSAFARASYTWELRGDIASARAALQRALQDAGTPADTAFARYYLGELAWNSGDRAGAGEQYAAGLAADPSYLPLVAGRAKVAATRGQTEAAIRDYTTVISRVPQPLYVIELGELYQSLGRRQDAARSYELVRAEERLFTANGVNVDLELALFEADHGDPAVGLRAARAEWGRRQSVFVADALGWALHATGRDREALGYARTALRLGTRNASFYYHLGMIEKSLGMTAAARVHIGAALAINPHFSPLYAPLAKRTLQELGGR